MYAIAFHPSSWNSYQFLSDDKTQNDGAKVEEKWFKGVDLLQVKPVDELWKNSKKSSQNFAKH